jgi:hypothetical protein
VDGGALVKARLIQTVDGMAIRSEFGPEVDLVAAMEVRGYAFLKLNSNPRQRDELQGQPKFKGLNGPMWDGDAIRYEDPATTRTVSQ